MSPTIPPAIRYTERLGEAGIEPSVGSVGGSYEDALAETINGLLSLETVECVTFTWVGWFNHLRLLESIGNIPPAEAEELYYALLDAQQMAA